MKKNKKIALTIGTVLLLGLSIIASSSCDDEKKNDGDNTAETRNPDEVTGSWGIVIK